jgi:trehalose/maltose hydrolase-like predicted phosphorylase
MGLLSRHTADLDAGVPARGLHGEAYRGHVFWDELFVFPLLNLRFPELTRALLLYRYRRLPQARLLAHQTCAAGALFPWQSGSDGREETPEWFYNPRSRRWMVDNSRRQYHVNLAVAYNVWQYYQVTGDVDFLAAYGAELLVEIARFWAAIAEHDPAADRHHLRGVMGPDEFHDGYPDRPGAGVDDNAYVAVMTSWVLARVLDTHRVLGGHHTEDLWQRLGVTDAELRHWDHLSRRLHVPLLPNGLLAQFTGYGDLDELDWDAYRAATATSAASTSSWRRRTTPPTATRRPSRPTCSCCSTCSAPTSSPRSCTASATTSTPRPSPPPSPTTSPAPATARR